MASGASTASMYVSLQLFCIQDISPILPFKVEKDAGTGKKWFEKDAGPDNENEILRVKWLIYTEERWQSNSK
mgnify:CR=1 FL=1